MTMEQCPYCTPPWPHEHVGNVNLPLLLIVRDIAQLKELYFHGTDEQCTRIIDIRDQEKFEQVLLEVKDIEKALKVFHGCV